MLSDDINKSIGSAVSGALGRAKTWAAGEKVRPRRAGFAVGGSGQATGGAMTVRGRTGGRLVRPRTVTQAPGGSTTVSGGGLTRTGQIAAGGTAAGAVGLGGYAMTRDREFGKSAAFSDVEADIVEVGKSRAYGARALEALGSAKRPSAWTSPDGGSTAAAGSPGFVAEAAGRYLGQGARANERRRRLIRTNAAIAGTAAAGGAGVVAADAASKKRKAKQDEPVEKNAPVLSAAFSDVDGAIAKAADDFNGHGAPSTGRKATAVLAGGWHPLVAGKKGKKARAFGTTMGRSLAGYAGGGVAGAGTGAALSALTRGKVPMQASTMGGAYTGAIGGTAAGSLSAVKENQRKGRLKTERDD